MPSLDNLVLLSSVREHNRRPSIIVMIVVDRPVVPQLTFLTAGHAIYLRKLFAIEALLTIVKRLRDSRPS